MTVSGGSGFHLKEKEIKLEKKSFSSRMPRIPAKTKQPESIG